MAKNELDVKRIQRKFGLRSIVAIALHIPIVALFFFVFGDPPGIPTITPGQLLLLMAAIFAFEVWCTYWVFVLLKRELDALPEQEGNSK